MILSSNFKLSPSKVAKSEIVLLQLLLKQIHNEKHAMFY